MKKAVWVLAMILSISLPGLASSSGKADDSEKGEAIESEVEKEPTLEDTLLPMEQLDRMYRDKLAQIAVKKTELESLEDEADRLLAIMRYQKQGEDRLRQMKRDLERKKKEKEKESEDSKD